MIRDYAKTENMNAWLRHPVLGDPSFDTFERLGQTVHRSAPPYEWAVNGSIFCDFDGTWYYYAGLYPRGYACIAAPRFRIYCSKDKGSSWEDLGWGFEEGFSFDGYDIAFDGCPDAFLTYDKKLKKYILTYDTASNDYTWETAYDPKYNVESGVGVAIADSPAGPFERLTSLVVSNRKVHGRFGRYTRIYASCVVPRENDYIAFCLADSERHFAWALTVLTAPTLEGPWSDPHVVLDCERPGYYPCPLEFFPVEIHGDHVVAHATSVAMNRNYQASFTAPLEQAHIPSAWTMTDDGNVWHAHDHPDEHFGIWGQTIHGFNENGKYIVMHASRSSEDLGTLGLAVRDIDTPYSDGFTMTAHNGPSISPIKASYGELAIDAEFKYKGRVDISFAYQGTLGPAENVSDAVPSTAAMSDYCAVRFNDNTCSLITVSCDGSVTTHTSAPISDSMISLGLTRNKDGEISVSVNGQTLCKDITLTDKVAPLAIVLGEHSRIDCQKFAVDGEEHPYVWRWNAEDALLGAGQYYPDQTVVTPDQALIPDRWHRLPDGYVGEGQVSAKWNLHGSSFAIELKRDPCFGVAGIWVDGYFYGSVNLCGQGNTEYSVEDIENGAHALYVSPLRGRIAISGCRASGRLPKN